MNTPETKIRSADQLSRRQKIVRRAVPIALLAAGIGIGTEKMQSDAVPVHAEAHASVAKTVSGSTTFENGEPGHVTAEQLLKDLIRRAAKTEFASVQVNGVEKDTSMTDEELDNLVDDLPVYEQADELLKKAGYDEKLPDAGDTLSASVLVEIDTNKKLTYNVENAAIFDVVNNH